MQRIVEIKASVNGAHKNQPYYGVVLGGYALIPEDMELPNFPFGDVDAAEIDGVMTVIKWTPGEIPAPVEPVLTPTEQRENAYNTRPLVEWEGEMLTVTKAAQLWQYYAAEGSDKAVELQVLIAAAKESIRAEYPDEEGTT